MMKMFHYLVLWLVEKSQEEIEHDSQHEGEQPKDPNPSPLVHVLIIQISD